MRTIRVVSPGQSYRKCTSSATLYVRCLQCLPQAHTPSIALRHHSSKKEGCHKLVLGVCLKWCSGQLFSLFFFWGGGGGGQGVLSVALPFFMSSCHEVFGLCDRKQAGSTCFFHLLLLPDIQSRFVVRQGQTCSTDPGWNQDRTLDLPCAKR